MQIEFLADRPEFIPTLAEWHLREWGYLRPGATIETRISRLQAARGRGAPPSVFIATEGVRLLGSAMLVRHDMDTRMDLSPWLAGVFTAPEFRKMGVATKLTLHVVQQAAQFGFPRLYLYTPSAEAFYARLGWEVVERCQYKNTDVTIMSHDEIAKPAE